MLARWSKGLSGEDVCIPHDKEIPWKLKPCQKGLLHLVSFLDLICTAKLTRQYRLINFPQASVYTYFAWERKIIIKVLCLCPKIDHPAWSFQTWQLKYPAFTYSGLCKSMLTASRQIFLIRKLHPQLNSILRKMGLRKHFETWTAAFNFLYPLTLYPDFYLSDKKSWIFLFLLPLS